MVDLWSIYDQLMNFKQIEHIECWSEGDLLGKFACYKPNDASVLAYAILSNALIKHVIFFSVLPLSLF